MSAQNSGSPSAMRSIITHIHVYSSVPCFGFIPFFYVCICLYRFIDANAHIFSPRRFKFKGDQIIQAYCRSVSLSSSPARVRAPTHWPIDPSRLRSPHRSVESSLRIGYEKVEKSHADIQVYRAYHWSSTSFPQTVVGLDGHSAEHLRRGAGGRQQVDWDLRDLGQI